MKCYLQNKLNGLDAFNDSRNSIERLNASLISKAEPNFLGIQSSWQEFFVRQLGTEYISIEKRKKIASL